MIRDLLIAAVLGAVGGALAEGGWFSSRSTYPATGRTWLEHAREGYEPYTEVVQ